MDVTALNPAPQRLALAPPTEPSPSGNGGEEPGFQAFGADGFTFLDFLDIINPLQHIPLVSTLYRSVTGDTIDPGARVAGSTLYGGPIGAALAVVDVAVEQATGKDVGENIVALFESSPPPETLATAAGPARLEEKEEAEHAEVQRWAEQEAAYRAAQAAALGLRPGPNGEPAAKIATWTEPARPGRTPPPTVAAQTALAVQALASASDTGQLIALNSANGDNSVIETEKPAPPGALAANGGWFTDTMLAALTKYQDNQRLADLMAAQKSAVE